MVSPDSAPSIHLNPSALFPNIEDAEKDEKCQLISKIFNEMTLHCDMSKKTQQNLIKEAQTRYEYLSKEERITLPVAAQSAFFLYRRGVSIETAKKYYSYRLNESDKNKWVIIQTS